MNRTFLTFALAAASSLSIASSVAGLGCSAPETGTHSARDVSDEPSGAGSAAPNADAPSEQGALRPVPVADRLRALDKTVFKVDVDGLPAMGSPNAPLTIVLFSDYECPFCRKIEPQIARLRAEHGSDVRVVLAPRPLPRHERAKPAALAAIAAAEQGKLEPMHRALVALDGKLDDASITSAAREAGLDLQRFEVDRRSEKADKTLAKAEELAKRFSVVGTPTTFLNGRRITGAVPDMIYHLGEEQLALGRGLIREGVPASAVYDKLVGGGLEAAGPDPTVTTIRVTGADDATEKAAVARAGEMASCWRSSSAQPKLAVELTIDAEGKVAHVTAEPAEHAECVTKAASAWAFEKTGVESKVKLVIGTP